MFVNTKFVGENAVVNLFCSKGKPKPTLSGLGIISSVVDLVLPAPNWSCNDPESINLAANLLYTVFNSNK